MEYGGQLLASAVDDNTGCCQMLSRAETLHLQNWLPYKTLQVR